MIEKRFEIVKSKLIKDGWVISDKLKQFTFPTLKGDKRALVSYCKALNELHEENEQLKQDKFICLDCEHSGYAEIGCLCEYQDCWVEDIHKCENYKEY